MKLQLANLFYGSTAYSVESNEVSPLPLEFDFDHPEECARKVFAIMSNASGGHPLRDCMLKVNDERMTANLSANGCHVFYAPDNRPKMTLEQVIEMEKRTKTTLLGTVTTDQYGEGWKRAVWVK